MRPSHLPRRAGEGGRGYEAVAPPSEGGERAGGGMRPSDLPRRAGEGGRRYGPSDLPQRAGGGMRPSDLRRGSAGMVLNQNLEICAPRDSNS